ncbi:MAG: family 43 glycosylhydrolase [Opitutaceae bacterium]|nr:family 43 glycosylhydrolase [Opitutaceae bacterium]
MFPARYLHRLVLPSLLVAGAPVLRADDPPNPTFADVTVHDPAVIKAGARWYVYGSHGASAWTEDLMRWTQVATSVTSGTPAHFNTFQSELSEMIAWTNATTLWAADVIQLGDGRFYYYYNVWTDFQGYRSYMGLAVADGIEGPYTDVGEILRGGTGISGFNPSIHPNTIDPDVFYDKDGQLWMLYGSYSGGIFILRLDQTVGSPTFGRPLPGQGWGTRLIGGNHAQIEGGYIITSPESGYYYLFVSFGGLAANGGYNMRVFRSTNPDGPYLDAAGNNMATTAIPNSQWSTIAPYGVKLMGNCQFQTVAGETGTARPGYVSPGHNSAYYDATTDKYFLIFHTRFVGQGEFHQVRVHPMFVNADDWLVVAPHRYAGETIAPTDVGRIVSDYKLINHGKDITTTVKYSSTITLAADGTVSGSSTGTWQLTGDYDATLVLGGVTYRGVFVRQWDESRGRWLLAFTALDGATGTQIWGSKVAVNTAPAFVTQPTASTTITAGDTLALTSLASGEPAPTYQWLKDGTAIDGATDRSFTIAKATAGDAGTYTVVATNSAGSATSTAAAVVVNVPPRITAHPASLTQPAGSAATLTVAATGTGVLGYQWFKGAVAVEGATASSLAFAALTTGDAADYTVTVTDSGGTTTSRIARIVVAEPAPGRISNVSIRSVASRGGNPLILGFVVNGEGKDVLIRAAGPELIRFQVSGTMPDPALAVHATINNVDTIVGSNDNWGDSGQAPALEALFAQLSAFRFTDRTSKDAALATTVGGSRTVHVASAEPVQSGVVLVECYDATDAVQPRFVNVSARNYAGSGSETLIAGFVIDGNTPKRVLIRGIGPTLTRYQVTGVMPDPRLEVHTTIANQDRIVATNDEWSAEPGAAEAFAATYAFSLPAGSLDAAVVVTLPAGSYTAHVAGFGGGTGEALVEVYELP